LAEELIRKSKWSLIRSPNLSGRSDTSASVRAGELENSPFIIGLTAHLDLEPAEPQLTDTVLSFLIEIEELLPDTDVRVMFDAGNTVSLAIARAILALDIGVDGLIAAPNPEQATGSDPNPMEDLLNDPRLNWIELVTAKSGAPHGLLVPSVADFLIRRSSLLLALWDGRSSSMPNDTADHIFRFLGVRGEPGETVHRVEVSTVVDDPDVMSQLVFWLPARPGTNAASEGARKPCYLLSAGDNVLEVQQSMPSSLKQRLADLNEYNLEFERLTAEGSLVRGESLLRNTPAEMATSDASVLRTLDRQFVKADSLAGHMQRRSDRLFNVFGIMGFAMGLAYLIYDKITESKILLMFYMLILFISLLAFYFFQSKRWFGKYLSYRALAETLRVLFYLALAGVDRRIRTRELIALTGVCKFSGFGWISFVLDSTEPTVVQADHSSAVYSHRAQLVDRGWIEDQYRYFVRKVASMERRRYWVGRLKSGVFVSVVIVLSVMFMLGGALHDIDARTGLPVKNVLTFCSGVLAVVLGVWELRQNKMAAQELLWQYRNQLSQFQRARIQLQRTTSRGRRDAILEELGENSLMEIYLWAIHRYHREHAPPAAP
jgi:hypothetical protein